MGILDALKDYQPIDLSKRKILQGEAVIQVQECKVKHSDKTSKDYLSFKADVINVVKEKEPNSLVAGNQFELFFDVDDERKLKKLQNNLFTAGFALDVSSEESLNASMAGLENKLIYAFFGKGKFKPEGEVEDIEFQTYKFSPQKKITPENSIPQIPF